MSRLSSAASVLVVAAVVTLASGCSRSEEPGPAAGQPGIAAPAITTGEAARPSRGTRIAAHDLSVDEALGGHTLSRHVGRTDDDLAERLRREPHISAASTYTDRATAERVVGAALVSAGRRLQTWQDRSGRRPNLVVRYTDDTASIGRSLSRDARIAVACRRAIVVLRWDDSASHFYVLTSYPETE